MSKLMLWDNRNKRFVPWQRTWRDSECDLDNDYDFKLEEFFITHEGHIISHTYDHGICDTHYELQGKPRYTIKLVVDDPVYECPCGTAFKKSEGASSCGWLACPACGDCEDLTIVSEKEVSAEAMRKIICTS